MENDGRTRRRAWDLVTGLLVLAIGLALLLGNFDLVDARVALRQYWPALLVFIGLRLTILRRNDADFAGGIFWMATGALFFLSNLGWINAPIRNLIWPLLVIWFGVAMLYKAPHCSGDRANHGGES